MPKNEKSQLFVNSNNILDERKRKILLAIINIYLESGEPVGSRTISKKLSEKLSSATIRNEMSDLKDMGYLIQPHTSSGSIPSDEGYRLYVNNLIKEKESEIKSLKTEMTARVDKLEDMFKTLVKTIASNTNYAALIAGPSINNNIIKYVQISNLDDNKILVVLVAEGNFVKTVIVELNSIIDAKSMLDVSMNLNNILSGLRVSELAESSIKNEIDKLSKNKNEIKIIINAIINDFKNKNDVDNIWTYGSNNFFKYKEFVENENVSNLVEAFEHKEELAKLVDKSNADKEESETGLKIYIGEESKVNAMKNCSVITANCDFGNGLKGTIGVVGPKRMDYEKVLKTIKNSMQNLSKELND